MYTEPKITDWFPTTRKEMKKHGWEDLDVILITGDAYIDHPSFGTAVIGRLIEREGFKVGMIAQPNWKDDLRDFKKLGKPRLFFGVTAGNMDSMINHYTANKRLRSDDAYPADGKAGFRPDYPTIVYTKILKELFPDVPVVLGGIEASLRRVTHYDYWQDQLRPSFLYESGADMLVYGMGEQPLIELLRMLDKGVPFDSLKTIRQTSFLQPLDAKLPKSKKWETLELTSHEDCIADRKAYAANFKHVEQESNKMNARRLTQEVGGMKLVINPPFPTMEAEEIDGSFDLPYTRLPHPKYKKRGPIPAFDMIKFSINMHRGCFGGCSFCTISAHQGKFIASRSKESILKEVDQVTKMPDFKGYISDLGGPSANMYKMKGVDIPMCEVCIRPSCIFPKICSNLDTSHKPMLEIYQEAAAHPKVKKAFVSSGIRYDMLLGKPEDEEHNQHDKYVKQLITHHVSGRLKVAPEHASDKVLKLMRKPSFKLFHDFKDKFDRINQEQGLNQQLIPYFISSHPGCQMEDMANLAKETKALGYRLEQTQDLTPTPMTVSAVIYYSGYHPYTLKPVYTPKTKEEKQDQRKFFYWYKVENAAWIKDTLRSLKLDSYIPAIFSSQKSGDSNSAPKKTDFSKSKRKNKNVNSPKKKHWSKGAGRK